MWCHHSPRSGISSARRISRISRRITRSAIRSPEAAAMMTDTKVTRKFIGTAVPRHFNKTLAETLQLNIDKVGHAEMERGRANVCQGGATSHRRQGRSGSRARKESSEPPPARPESGASDDIGDVSWAVPTVTLRYPANIPNLPPATTRANAIAMATPDRAQGHRRRLQGDGDDR